MSSASADTTEPASAVAQEEFDAFISYPRVARGWMVRLERDLEARGLRCFSDKRLLAGDPVADKLQAGLARSATLIALWHRDAPANTQMLLEIDAFRSVRSHILPVFLGEASIPMAPRVLGDLQGVIVPDDVVAAGPASGSAAWERVVDDVADFVLARQVPERLRLMRRLPSRGPRPGWVDLSDRTHEVLEWAAGAETRDIGTRALLFGLFKSEGPNGPLHRVLEEAGVEPRELFEAMERLPARGRFSSSDVIRRPMRDVPLLSPNAEQTFRDAWEIAREAGFSQITNSALLLAVIAASGTTATVALRDVLGAARVYRLVDALLRNPTLLEREQERQPSTTVTSDLWTLEDDLDHELFADAIATFICDPRSRPPLTIGVKGRWGAGKTSVMRKVREKLDPAPTSDPPRPTRLTIETVLDRTKDVSPEKAADVLEPEHDDASRRVTIWFNAWKYQSREQLWAGLAHSILEQVDDRLTPMESDRLWASLQLRRLSLRRLRRDFYAYVLLRAAKGLVATLVAVVAVLVALIVDRTGLLIALPGLVGGLLLVRGQVAGAMKHEVSRAVPKLVEQPDYDTKAGYLHLVDSDLRRILRAAGATRERPFVVFVDDLDRCSYQTVAEVIEALNVFLAGDFDTCVFVIAMEPELIAAQVRAAYEPLFKQLGDEDGDLGWRFLEKMVQLPLSLPMPGEAQIQQLVDGVLGRDGGSQGVRSYAWDAAEVTAARERLGGEGGPEGLSGVAGRVAEARSTADGEPGRQLDDVALQQAARLEFAVLFRDTQAQDLVLRYARDLSGNPRELKRFVNVFRFFAYLDFWRRLAGRSSPGIEGAAKLARISISWPNLARALVSRSGSHDESLIAVLERASRSDAWDAEVEALSEPLRGSIVAATGLRAVLRESPDVAPAAAQFL